MAAYTSVVSLHRSYLFTGLGPRKVVADLLERTWFFQLPSRLSGNTSVLSPAFVFLGGELFPVSGSWKGSGRWGGGGSSSPGPLRWAPALALPGRGVPLPRAHKRDLVPVLAYR